MPKGSFAMADFRVRNPDADRVASSGKIDGEKPTRRLYRFANPNAQLGPRNKEAVEELRGCNRKGCKLRMSSRYVPNARVIHAQSVEVVFHQGERKNRP